jgi:GAF domain-containing protein
VIGPKDFQESLLQLSSLMLGEETMHSVLQRVVDLTAISVPGCDHCGVSLLSDGRVTTAAATDGTALQVDGAQYVNGEGPCLQAAVAGEVVRVEDLAKDNRFPRFAADAVGLGINSSLSFPLTVGNRTLGALNLYGTQIAAFSERSEEIGIRFARQAAATVANAEVHQRMADVIVQLNEALTSRSTIDQARGILIANTGCSAEQALGLLKEQSQHENVKLRTIAAEIVRNAMTGSWEPD